jgi:hypothetical protein
LELDAARAVDRALGYVYEQQKGYMAQLPFDIDAELRGMARESTVCMRHQVTWFVQSSRVYMMKVIIDRGGVMVSRPLVL